MLKLKQNLSGQSLALVDVFVTLHAQDAQASRGILRYTLSRVVETNKVYALPGGSYGNTSAYRWKHTQILLVTAFSATLHY